MKIIEVRDGFVKIESDKKIDVSSFLELKGTEKRYIAQVIRSKNNGASYNVYAKIIFIYDGMLKKYDKTMPDNSAEISEFSFETVNNSFSYVNPIVAGKFISGGNNILMDSAGFNKSTMISVDSPEMNNIIVMNLAKQFRQTGKTIVIDMLGILNGDKYVAGRDFKLPLNTESLKFMYEDCLNDATADSKNLIKEIFCDLVEYSKSVKFLPFITLKTIVDDMVEKSHIFKLLVFKNKLAKFEEAGYFASKPADAENLSKILQSDFAVIDLSQVDGLFQNRYLSVILQELETTYPQTSVFVEASNSINKKNIKSLLYSEYINTIFVTHSKFKYLADLKPMFKNYILENSYANKNVFSLYSFFLESMTSDNYLIVGEGTNYVPLVSNLEKYDVVIEKLPQDSISEEVIDTEYDEQVTDDIENIVYKVSESDTVPAESPVQELEIPEEIEVDDTDLVSDEEPEVLTEDTEATEDVTATEDVIVSEEKDESSYGIFSDSEDEIPLQEDTDETGNDTEVVSEETETEPETLTEADDTYEEKPNEQQDITETEPEEILEEDVEIPVELENEFDEIEQQVSDSEDNEIISDNGADELEQIAEPEIIPLENQDTVPGEFEEIDTSDIDDEDILVHLDDVEDEEIKEYVANRETSAGQLNPEDIDQDIVEAVDQVFTTIKDDSISDSDLDFIDALNETDSENIGETEDEIFSSNDAETLQNFDSGEDEEESFLEPLNEISDSMINEPEKEILETRESSTPIVPIYDAEIPNEDKVVSDAIEQGDTVLHAKYGSGVVEKMIKYGNKNLYSINFDNVGRRLLDPTLTEIKKA